MNMSKTDFIYLKIGAIVSHFVRGFFLLTVYKYIHIIAVCRSTFSIRNSSLSSLLMYAKPV